MGKHGQSHTLRPLAEVGAQRQGSGSSVALSVSSRKTSLVSVQPSAQQTAVTDELSFTDNFVLLRFTMLVVLLVCITWTTWLILLTIAPTWAANYLMNTTNSDEGNFWLIVDTKLNESAQSLWFAVGGTRVSLRAVEAGDVEENGDEVPKTTQVLRNFIVRYLPVKLKPEENWTTPTSSN